MITNYDDDKDILFLKGLTGEFYCLCHGFVYTNEDDFENECKPFVKKGIGDVELKNYKKVSELVKKFNERLFPELNQHKNNDAALQITRAFLIKLIETRKIEKKEIILLNLIYDKIKKSREEKNDNK